MMPWTLDVPADPVGDVSLRALLAWAAEAASVLGAPVPERTHWANYAYRSSRAGFMAAAAYGGTAGEYERRVEALYPLSWLADIATADRLPRLDPDQVKHGAEHDPLTLWAEASRVVEAAEGGHAARRDARRRADELLPDAITFAGELLALLRGRTPVQAGPTVTPVMFTN